MDTKKKTNNLADPQHAIPWVGQVVGHVFGHDDALVVEHEIKQQVAAGQSILDILGRLVPFLGQLLMGGSVTLSLTDLINIIRGTPATASHAG